MGALLVAVAICLTGARSAVAERLQTVKKTVLRSAPRPRKPIVARVPKGAVVEVRRRKPGWRKVAYKGAVGWVQVGSLGPVTGENSEPAADSEPDGADESASAAKPAADGGASAAVADDEPESNSEQGGGWSEVDLSQDGIRCAVETKLYEKPGERSAVVTTLAAGTHVELLGRRGRWVRVRAADELGWVARSTLTAGAQRSSRAGRTRADDEERADLTGFRTKGFVRIDTVEGAAGIVTVVVALGDGRAYQQPAASRRPLFHTRAGQVMKLIGTADDGKWLLVESTDRSQQRGWLLASGVREARVSATELDKMVAEGAVGSGSDADISIAAAAGNRSGEFLRAPMRARLSALLGASSVGMSFSSDGSTALSQYRISANTTSAGITGDVVFQALGSLQVGADFRYAISVGMPGIRYHQGDEMSEPISFSLQEIDAAVRVGSDLDVGDGLAIYGRAGAYGSWFQVDDLDNAGMLGREGVKGLQAGLRAEFVVGESLLLEAGGDVLLFGTRGQTPGLKDGERSDTNAFFGTLNGWYWLSPVWALSGAYRPLWSFNSWSGPSQRQPDVTEASRSDRHHSVLFGLTRVVK